MYGQKNPNQTWHFYQVNQKPILFYLLRIYGCKEPNKTVDIDDVIYQFKQRDKITYKNIPKHTTYLKQKEKFKNDFQKYYFKTSKINIIIQKNQTKADLATFLHGALFSPSPSTLLKAIKNNNLTTWPGLTEEIIKKHLPPSNATAKGHLNQEQQGLGN